MDDILFSAPEYQKDQSFVTVQYRFTGSVDDGWKIEREGEVCLELGAGYVPVKTLYCGICSTDLARYLLPFPLPQIIGHEVVAEYYGESVAIEINASHAARGLTEHDCEYCHKGQDTHCPERMTLGIDRLPGGFSPWLLAPIHAIHRLPDTVTPHAGVLIEPFAAALKAVEVSPPASGEQVAVLGPRRLGMLVIAALDSYRKLHNISFEIVAVMRHETLQQTAQQLGADRVVLLQQDRLDDVYKQFDTVFDTTGSPAGFELAMNMATQTVHLKSTHGQPIMGFDHMTSMVINEQSLSGLTEQKLHQLITEHVGRAKIYVSPLLRQNKSLSQLDSSHEQISCIDDSLFDQKIFKPFDFALVSSMYELIQLTRPVTIQGQSLLRATGTVLFSSVNNTWDESDLMRKIGQEQLHLKTSRCGDFAKTINVFRQRPGLAAMLEKQLVTQTMDLGHLDEAMKWARQSDKSIKVVVKTN